VTRAYALASRQRNGRLEPPLLLLLDEVGAIAPLPTLPAIMGQGASQGILCAWAAQTFNQLKAKWGEDWATSILGASSHKIIFGGAAADTELLTQISELFGEWDRWVSPFGTGRTAQARHMLAALGKNPQNPVHSKEKVLTVNDLFQKPKGQATVIADTPAGPQFASVGVPHAATVSPFREAVNAESAIQKQLMGHEHEPVHLKSSATITRVFSELSPPERERFEKEQHRLLGQIKELEELASLARDDRLRKEPGLARELASWRAIAAQSRTERAQSELEIVFAFASGQIAHFTYTVIPPAELEPPTESPKEPRPQQPIPPRRPIQRAQTWSESR
jgi:TraM recognition site of TraD and TraG